MMFDVPDAWQALAERLAAGNWRRSVILGATDTGKSSLGLFLARHLFERGLKVGLLDADLGQKMVGPPACVTMGLWTGGAIDLRGLRFVGETNPAANIAAVVGATARLANEPGLDRLIVNTSGLIGGPGIALKRWKLDALDPDHIVAIECSDELRPILAPLPPGRIHRLQPSPAATRKTPSMRKRARRAGLHAALEGATLQLFPNTVADDLARFPIEGDRLRLCGLANAEGDDQALGVVRPLQFMARSQIWTSADPREIHRVRLGMALPKDLNDVRMPLAQPSSDF